MVLGLSGKALVGKDIVADYLLENHGWVRKTGFATNLKTACVEIFDLTWDQVLTQQGKSTGLNKPVVITKDILLKLIEWMRKTHDVALHYRPYLHLIGVELKKPREILQFVGTEVMRHYAPDYHCEVVFKSILQNEKVIITDVRFPNEAQNILDVNGYLVRIERPEELKARHDVAFNTTHLSEIALDGWVDWSYTIINDGRVLNVLYKTIDEMLEKLGEPND